MHVFKVTGMSCSHCVRAITTALQALDAAAQVEVDLEAGEVRVESQLSSAEVVAALAEEGFAAQPA
ncbi:cation transporter [Pseudomonas sp. NW5]|uniref:heavy-metal-associated domain-containing protein n=1 Tax=Pseudomonas sp. NW5 TaxID=2934934 RepID=UPI00202093D4|nr:cation transporter [Pseudomonas sp. NW5]MCL7461203.1 cation transporter [Pseudomonas sp. NW5]